MSWNPFTRTKKPKISIQNTTSMASAAAESNVRQKFGLRTRQSKLANVLKNPGTVEYTNQAAIYKQKLEEEYKMKYEKYINFTHALAKPLQAFGSEQQVKSALTDVATQLKEEIQKTKGGASNNLEEEEETVNITLPRRVAILILGIIQVILYFLAFLLFILVSLSGESSNFFVNASISSNEKNESKKVKEWEGGKKTRRKRRY